MQTQENSDAIKGTMLDGLQGIDRYLAMINNRLEMLIDSDLPDYVKSDLVQMVQAEQEASQILHSLSLLCHR